MGKDRGAEGWGMGVAGVGPLRSLIHRLVGFDRVPQRVRGEGVMWDYLRVEYRYIRIKV